MALNNIVRLGYIAARSTLKNEMLYASPSTAHEIYKLPVVVFFGGDVQDYPENMTAHRDHGKYVEWSLTSTTSLLANKFPACHILVVKPSRMERKTFSCYDNFVVSNSVGAPTHDPGIKAVTHLIDLILEGLKKATEVNQESENPSFSPPNSISLDAVDDITLIGFSKGCVVLNQLIIEFRGLSVIEKLGDGDLHKFMEKIHNMYWLDGGHAGGSQTWITDSPVLNSLASQKHININVQVTPYQVEDEQRPWIKRECKMFCKILQRAGCQIKYQLHSSDEPPSLFIHFRLLNEFT
ncbi:hypothetical protein SK128_009578 [Halocaridina rubra]|uniref:Uncharacterized protein n=1 Tax=Halocaridina rubra TaxID=373956 RepID=A0AAN8XIL4_HALRR